MSKILATGLTVAVGLALVGSCAKASSWQSFAMDHRGHHHSYGGPSVVFPGPYNFYNQYDGGPRVIHVDPDMRWDDKPLPCTHSVDCGSKAWETPAEGRARAEADEAACAPVVVTGDVRTVHHALGCRR